MTTGDIHSETNILQNQKFLLYIFSQAQRLLIKILTKQTQQTVMIVPHYIEQENHVKD